MKTAKKLFSLLLVAVLLFSALPFQAFADTSTEATKTEYYVKFARYSGDIIETKKLSDSMTVTAPAVPQVENCTFDGWYVNGVKRQVESWTADDFAAAHTEVEGTVTKKYIRAVAQYTANHVHTFDQGVVTAPTCDAEGFTLYTSTCNVNGVACNVTKKENVTSKLGHDLKTTTIPATDTAAGSTIVECQRTGCTYKTTTGIDQLGTEVQFVDIEGGRATQTRSWQKGASISSSNIPTLNDLNGRKFIGWYTVNNGGGFQFDGGIWNPGNDNYATTYYARYQDSIYANYASVTVYANVYNGSRQVALVPLSNAIPFTVGEYILDDLMDRREYFINTFFSNYPQYPATDYEVADQAFYMNTTDAKITDGTTLAKGNTSVYIKIKAKGSAAAPVQLFVHNKVESGYVAHYDVPGFIAGETITLTYIKNFLQSKTGKTYNITAMHDQHDWDRMLAGFTCESNTVLEVGSNGLRIHIVAPTYTSSSSTTSKPASNPATGDNSMLEITAATMLLAAAAVVTLTQLRKRKMI